MKYMGITPYYQIYESYMGMGDTTKAESTLKSLPDKFPGDKSITLASIFTSKAEKTKRLLNTLRSPKRRILQKLTSRCCR